jgi:hypothetical protein
MGAPEPLRELAGLLAGEPLLAPHVSLAEGEAAPLAQLVAAGPRTAADGDAYALIVEAVREGYLLHYGESRLLKGIDPDLALLAGDHLYALGLDRLATLGDLEAVRELSDLISLAAQVSDGSRGPDRAAQELSALWLATATAIAVGPSNEHSAAKAALRAGAPDAAEALDRAATRSASSGDLRHELELATDAIDFRPRTPSELG